jgi:hypothetical protein
VFGRSHQALALQGPPPVLPPRILAGGDPAGVLPARPAPAKAAPAGMFGQGVQPQRVDIARLGAYILAANSNPLGPLALQLDAQREHDALQAQRHFRTEDRLDRQHQWTQTYQSRPAIRTVNGQVVSVPFGGGDPTVLYQAPEDFEIYADAMGLQPDTEEYRTAMQDFILRGSGPTSFGYRGDLETQRQGNRVALEGVRQGGRERLEGIRQGNRIGLEGVRQGNRQTNIDRREQHYRSRPQRASGRGGNAAVIVNPQTGQRMTLQNGRWVPVQ